MCAKCFATSAETPMLEKAIHVNGGEQRTDNSALWRAAVAVLAAAHAPFPVAIPFLDRRS